MPPTNLQAYDYFALGIEQKHLFTKESNQKAQELFRKALEIDPSYARAYYGLAMSYGMDADFGRGESWEQSMENWRTALVKATALDPYDNSAHMEFAFYHARAGSLDLALDELEESFELNPNDADALAIAAFILVRAGQPERARESVERAMRLNPHHPDWYYAPAREAYFFTRGFAETVDALKKRKHPSPMLDPLFLSLSYAQLGHDRAVGVSVKQLFKDQADWSAEKFLSDTGTFARDVELDLFLDSVAKAGLPLCATEAQLAKYPDMERLGPCEQQRAKS